MKYPIDTIVQMARNIISTFVQQWINSGVHQHICCQWNWTEVCSNNTCWPHYCRNPIRKLCGIANSGRKRNKLNSVGERKNDFFPNCTTESIRQVMHFIHNNVTKLMKSGTFRIEHVAENFSCHDDNGSITIDGLISGKKSNIIFPPSCTEVTILLIR